MFTARRLLIILCLFYIWIWAGLGLAEEEDFLVSFEFSNDLFGGKTDRHFTHGTRIECLTEPHEWVTNLADQVPWFKAEEALSEAGGKFSGRVSISIGQNLYTPENTATTQLVREDRPYAGWLYAGLGLVANQGTRRYDKLELEIGMVGPASFAREVQTQWHSFFDINVPQGWDHQLKNEFGAVLYYERARRYSEYKRFFGLEFETIPHFGGALGNVFTYGAAGITFRLGADLENDFGPPRIRPSLPGGAYFRPYPGFNWYLFAGVEGRAVLRNIFLDGNTFRESHSVDKEILVGDLQTGIVLQRGRWRMSYTQIFRSKEFKGQNKGDVFGSMSFSYCF